MSITSLQISSDKENIYKKPFHRRKVSGELDVFEASRYFSGTNEVSNAPIFVQTIMRDHRSGGGRISLDLQIGKNNNQVPSSHNIQVIEKQISNEKKYKQPSSPGGKLASFLSSIFNQTSKKKKSKTSTQSAKDEDESPGGRRKRRSSISHFPSTLNSNYSSSFYSTSSNTSGFRTPPPYSQIPSKSCKETRNYLENKPQLLTMIKQSKKQGNLQNEVFDDENLKCKNLSNGFSEKVRIRDNQKQSESKISKMEVNDDGADSDSSSDLFELENYDLGYYPSGLPVYETTRVDSINRGNAPI